MPSRPLRPCCHVGCTELVVKGYCIKHTPEPRQYDKHRGSSSERGYDYRWQRFRDRYLKLNPLCVDCLTQGNIEPAVDVHHIVKLTEGGKRLEPSNCKPLCHVCHSVRTRRGE
jgi:5-methylcytosine-specific restriction protein A